MNIDTIHVILSNSNSIIRCCPKSHGFINYMYNFLIYITIAMHAYMFEYYVFNYSILVGLL